MLPLYYEYHNPVKILSGEAALENIPYELEILEAKAPLLLSDQGLVAAGAVDTVLKAMAPQKPAATFTDIPADSSVTVVNAIAKVYAEHACDSLIAVGGGSVIDTAKGVRMVISQRADDIEALMGTFPLSPSPPPPGPAARSPPWLSSPTPPGRSSRSTSPPICYRMLLCWTCA
jgi:alcohol dehydrogenase